MSILVWASGHWHVFDDSTQEVVDRGTDWKTEDPLARYPTAALYMAVPHEQAETDLIIE